MHQIDFRQVLDSLPEGVFATDRDSTIIYWNQAAERITGWRAEEVLGRCCSEHLLNHRTVLGKCLCGSECPLRRALRTQITTELPMILYASARDGRSIPLEVNHAPLRDAEGQVLGVIQTFREVTAALEHFEQTLTMQQEMLGNLSWQRDGLAVGMHYFRGDGIGHNLCLRAQMDEFTTALLLAEISGDSEPAALYGLQLRSLWERCRPLLDRPAAFMGTLNAHLHHIGCEHKALCCGLLVVADARSRTVCLVGAGQPAPLLFDPQGTVHPVPLEGAPLGWETASQYVPQAVLLEAGATLIAPTEGLVNLMDPQQHRLELAGLTRLLLQTGFPQRPLTAERLRNELLRATGHVRLPHDVTLLEIHHRLESAGL